MEMHYISKLGALMQCCSGRLLVILSLHMRTLLHAYENEYDSAQKAGIRLAMREFADALSAALDYTKADSVGFGSASANGDNAFLQIGKRMRDDVKKVPK